MVQKLKKWVKHRCKSTTVKAFQAYFACKIVPRNGVLLVIFSGFGTPAFPLVDILCPSITLLIVGPVMQIREVKKNSSQIKGLACCLMFKRQHVDCATAHAYNLPICQILSACNFGHGQSWAWSA